MDDANTNKQLRIYDSSSKFIRLSVDETIARGANKWLGWKCSAGVKALYIDYDGNAWVCNTASSQLNRFNDIEWKNTFRPMIAEFKNNVPPEWQSTGEKWKRLELDFKKTNTAFKKVLQYSQVGTVPGFLGNINEKFDVPVQWTTCQWAGCGCGADVVLSKAKTNDDKKVLAVTNDGFAGQRRTEKDLVHSLTSMAAVELNFPMPYQVLWDMSRKCNYDCSYCWESVHNRTGDLLSLDTLISTADVIMSTWNNETIRWNFGGGEPTLHRDLIDFMKYLKDHNQWTMVTSNGTRDYKYWRELAKYANSILLSAHFDGLVDEKDEDRFIKNISEICDNFKNRNDDSWLEIKIMSPPQFVDRAIALRNKINILGLLSQPTLSGRIIGVVSLVPIRGITDSTKILDYTKEQLSLLSTQ